MGHLSRAGSHTEEQTLAQTEVADTAFILAERVHHCPEDDGSSDDHLFAPREDDAHTLAMLRAIAVAIQLHRPASEPAALVGSQARQGMEIGIGEGGLNR